jgi:hypothetical protein
LTVGRWPLAVIHSKKLYKIEVYFNDSKQSANCHLSTVNFFCALTSHNSPTAKNIISDSTEFFIPIISSMSPKLSIPITMAIFSVKSK